MRKMVVIVEHQSIADLTVHCNKLWGNCTSACYNRDCMWISDGCVCDGRAIKPSKGTQEEKITYYLEMAEVEFNEIKEVFFR